MNKLAIFARQTALDRALIPIGLILFIFGFMVSNSKDTSNFIETKATISKTNLIQEEKHNEDEIEPAQYDVYVTYKADKQTYEEYFGQFSNYKEGDQITIIYDPDNPKLIASPGNPTITAYICMGIGILCIIIGIFSLYQALQKQRQLKEQEKSWK